jgi:hypothetical protein
VPPVIASTDAGPGAGLLVVRVGGASASSGAAVLEALMGGSSRTRLLQGLRRRLAAEIRERDDRDLPDSPVGVIEEWDDGPDGEAIPDQANGIDGPRPDEPLGIVRRRGQEIVQAVAGTQVPERRRGLSASMCVSRSQEHSTQRRDRSGVTGAAKVSRCLRPVVGIREPCYQAIDIVGTASLNDG